MVSEEQGQPDVPPPAVGSESAVAELNSPSTGSAGASDLWSKIKRHKVVEWTLAYLAAGFALVHAVEMASHAFEWPIQVQRLTIVAWVIGIPVAATIAWYHGHRAQHRVSRAELAILTVLLILAGGMLWFSSRRGAESESAAVTSIPAATVPALAAAFSPPPHSIAVLPFTNLSGDPKQEYFSDGMTEELINALSQINSLEVIARTSSFSFKGQNVDIGTIARKLNVGAILEGSIRRSGNTVRITAQLIDAVTGFHTWSQDYDRSLKNVLQLQSDIATTVAQQLQAKLVGDEAGKIEAGGTSNPEAHDAYLHGVNLLASADTRSEVESALRSFDQAIALDPNYALAYAQRAHALSFISTWYSSALDERRELLVQARQSVERALKIAPHVAEAHAILGMYVEYAALDFEGATRELDQALASAPGNAWVLKIYGGFHVQVGHYEKGLASMQRAIQLDPQNYQFRWDLATALWQARRFSDALAAIQRAEALKPGGTTAETTWTIYLGLGKVEQAQRLCETPSTPMQPDARRSCLAIVLHKLGRTKDAEHQLQELKAHEGDAGAYGYADIYAQWGDHKSALDWLARVERLRLPDLVMLRFDSMLDPIRDEPDFKALEKRLNFPP